MEELTPWTWNMYAYAQQFTECFLKRDQSVMNPFLFYSAFIIARRIYFKLLKAVVCRDVAMCSLQVLNPYRQKSECDTSFYQFLQ